jgi:predicted transposase/invertase (TIGR01784 family)
MGTITKFKVEKDPFYQDGVKKGIEKGEAIGEHNKSLEIAKNFKDLGVSIADIAKGTGLTIEEIKKL